MIMQVAWVTHHTSHATVHGDVLVMVVVCLLLAKAFSGKGKGK